jgi:RNA polymerase sigma-70 factor, ECF subfamily
LYSVRRIANMIACKGYESGPAGSLDCQNRAGHDVHVPADTKTLGDILYADKSKSRVSEEEWLQLVRAVAGGDQGALHSIYEQTHRIVFTLILRITMNRETAEEVTLDVFYDVWRKASTYDPANGSVVGWIMNQARSRAIDRLRFDQRKKRVNAYPDSLEPATDIVDPQQACLFEEQGRVLRNALEVLTPEERNAIETAFFSELTYEEAAKKLNQPLGTVKTRIRSALGKLREALRGD